MEAVGRLAGGVAHDFNNLLTIISGYGTMLLESVKHDAFAANQAEEILNASSRAAELVAKLLTFSRRQVIKPKPLDVNELVQGIEGMLQRLIGEHIQLRSVLDPHAGWIVADPNQMETALMNLATNARDAMPGGGVLSIETGRTTIDEERNPLLPDLPHGTYVRLSVRDTGHGMDADTQEHIFEPFFTTKQRGKGTGLGLSSVYGGVEQNGGRIFVSSAVGRGTTFSIYLPHFERAVCCDVQRVSFQKLPRGSETILLVEDEIALRRMVREALTTAGYRVWEAGNGAEALEYWAGRVGEIDLLVTDVVMPIMNGVKLAEELRRQRPGLEVVFMSGHATDMITRQGVLDPDVELLQKPFLPVVLVRKVREVLDRAAKRDRPDMVWLYR
jgi:CheY-like chemotaxis protein